jgi:hypothetical protein
MSHIHITDIYNLKARIHRLKYKIDTEDKDYSCKELANRYLNLVLDSIDEIIL